MPLRCFRFWASVVLWIAWLFPALKRLAWAVKTAPSASADLLGELGFRALVIVGIDFLLVALLLLGAFVLINLSLLHRRGVDRVGEENPSDLHFVSPHWEGMAAGGAQAGSASKTADVAGGTRDSDRTAA
jgi:hypothetical protein